MNPSNPFFSVIILAIAWLTCRLIRQHYSVQNPVGRFETIDGMRGFLAISVFIHHAYIWFDYVKTGSWQEPDSNLYTHFGQTAVMLFFMITGFLFTGKLLNTKADFNWTAFFISRFLRLAPMYYVSLALLVFIVFDFGNWELHADFFSIARAITRWASFAVLGTEAINASPYTAIINAGVVWSLPYEWLFYSCLPLIGMLLFGKKTRLIFMVIGIGMIVIFSFHKYINPYCFAAFLGGAFPAFIINQERFRTAAKSTFASIIVLVCPVLIVQFQTVYHPLSLLLVIVLFSLIALGNSVFGLLRNSTLKLLGEIGYSTYLLHGIVIFVMVYYVVGMETARKFSATEYCLLQFAVTPFAVTISFLGYRYIEKPCMDYSKRFNTLYSVKESPRPGAEKLNPGK